MAKRKLDEMSPIDRSRYELGEAIERTVGFEVLSRVQARILGTHLNVEGFRADNYARKSREEILWSISEVIDLRLVEMQTRRFATTRQLAYTGMLGLAVGSKEGLHFMSRPELIETSQIRALAEKNPKVDPNVFVDKTIEHDLDWLSTPTLPLGKL